MIYFSGHHHIIGTNLTRNIGECLCNNYNVEDEGGCNTLGLDPVRTGHAKYWCFVDPDSQCSDKKQSSIAEGHFYSFQACASKYSNNLNNLMIVIFKVVQDQLKFYHLKMTTQSFQQAMCLLTGVMQLGPMSGDKMAIKQILWLFLAVTKM